MPSKSKKTKNNKQQVWLLMTIIILLIVLSGALIAGIVRQAKVISQYELIAHLDNQACRYLADRGNDSRVDGGFVLNSKANKNGLKLIYYCYTGQATRSRTIQGKPIEGYSLGAIVSYFSSNTAAETYAKEKLNPLRYWSEDGSDQIQNKNYIFLVTDEKEPYFDAYRVRANAVVRVSLPCKSKNFSDCNMQANQLLDQELKGINVL